MCVCVCVCVCVCACMCVNGWILFIEHTYGSLYNILIVNVINLFH